MDDVLCLIGCKLGIRDCLIKHGFDDVWHNQGVLNEAAFLRQLKTKLIDEFNTEWHQKILNSDRFAFYRSFKERPFIESYLNDITIKRFRDVLIRFRLGINELKANKRFHTDNDFNKTCPFCPNALENETHIVFVCPKYNDLRLKYLNFVSNGYRDYNVPTLLGDQCIESNRNLGMFLYYSLKRREMSLST